MLLKTMCIEGNDSYCFRDKISFTSLREMTSTFFNYIYINMQKSTLLTREEK